MTRLEKQTFRTARERTRASVLWGLACLLWLSTARAEPTAQERADALFEEAKTLMAAGNLVLACPKLEESHRLRPGGGTVLRMALCWEQLGKFASAAKRFREARAFALRDGREDRKAIAEDRLKSLETSVSKLFLEGKRVREVTLDGDRVPFEPGVAFEVDPGEHVIKAFSTETSAKPFEASVIVAKGESKTIAMVFPGLGASTPLVPLTPTPRPQRSPAMVGTSVALGAASLVVMGVGGYFTLSARSHFKKSDASCFAGCDALGAEESRTALKHANLATGLFAGGFALAAGSVLTFLWSKRAPAPAGSALAESPNAGGFSVSLSPSTAAVSFSSSF